MTFEKKRITLKDGREALLYSPGPDEAAQMIDYLKRVCAETEYLASYPEELDGMTVEGEQAWLQGGLDSPDEMIINCSVDGKLAANCNISFYGKMKMRHRAIIGIAVFREYWGLGIGSAMIAELIAAARAREGVEILELEVYDENDRAIALYRKMGFEQVSVIPQAIRLRDGRYLGEVKMFRYLDE